MSEIVIEKIDVAYSENTIIDNLSLDIPRGKITTIIGPNGCGKSTLLKAIGRILKTQKGTIYLDGNKIHNMPTKELAKKMAILPQAPIAPEGLTVKELVSYGRYPYQTGIGKLKEEDKKIVLKALESTGLEELQDVYVDNLSGGQRQRVWIAMALAQETDIILLDEPTTYLDMAYQLEVLELLEELNKEYGRTVIMVLHDINMASKFADYMVALKNGKIVSAGCPNQVIVNEVLKLVYHIDADIILDPKCHKPICVSYQLLGKV